MEDHGESGPGSWTGLLSSAKCVQINQSQKTITQNSSGVKQLMDKPSSGAVLRMVVVAHMMNIEHCQFKCEKKLACFHSCAARVVGEI